MLRFNGFLDGITVHLHDQQQYTPQFPFFLQCVIELI